MKLLILGPTGKTGQHLVSQALASGHQVTVLVRDLSKLEIKHTHLQIVQGNVLDQNILDQVVQGHDAVLSALGVGNSFKSNNLLTAVTSLLIPAMERHHISRFIIVSAFGVGDTEKQANFFQKLFFRFLLKDIYRDKLRSDDMIRRSNLDWTIIYPVMYTDSPLSRKIIDGEVVAMKGIPTISRADVADFMLRQLTDTSYVRKRPIIKQG